MGDDAAALAALLESSTPGATHTLVHYLYVPGRTAAIEASKELQGRRFQVEERLSADQQSWLVLARHRVVPSEPLLAMTRRMLEELCTRLGGEYDGWEAHTHR